MREVKQVIVMRKDLGMRKGKMIAQGAHASLGAFLKHTNFLKDHEGIEYPIWAKKGSPLYRWLDGPFVKICVGINSEQELHKIAELAVNKNIPCALIKDAGRTEFKEPTYTCCGIGPWWADEIDTITGDLKLL
jgi:PTH2 family peptidyl-tRNA hydrolase